MRALVYSDWERMELASVPEPAPPGPDDVLVRVAACGICGSELDAFRHRSPRRPPPLVMGHEFCGTIDAVGSAVDGWRAGDRVIAHAVVHCGRCELCALGRTNLCAQRQVFGMHRPGAFTEIVVVPTRALLPWPTGLSATAATLAEPLANGLNAIGIGPLQAPARVVVIGAGPIGLMCVQAAATSPGASILVTDLVAERRETATQLGAAQTLDPRGADLPAACRALWSGRQPTYVIDAVGSRETKRQALSLVEPGGTVVWLGLHDNTLDLDTYDLTLAERRIVGTYSGSLQHLQHAVTLLTRDDAPTRDWVETVPLEDAVDAFNRMLRGQGTDIKAVLRIDPTIE